METKTNINTQKLAEELTKAYEQKDMFNYFTKVLKINPDEAIELVENFRTIVTNPDILIKEGSKEGETLDGNESNLDKAIWYVKPDIERLIKGNKKSLGLLQEEIGEQNS